VTPDELLTTWADIILSVVGPKGQWRKESLTFEEWRKLDESWLVLKQQKLRELAKHVGKADHE